jgi:hypothetical protein
MRPTAAEVEELRNETGSIRSALYGSPSFLTRSTIVFWGRRMCTVALLGLLLQIASCPSQRSPSIRTCTSFAFFAEAGEFTVYSRGRLLAKERANDMRDGQLRFVAVTPTRGLVYGNMGTAEADVHRTAESVVFVETSLAGSMHTFTVYDQWVADVRGFRATYIRNTENPLASPPEILRTIYTGYARTMDEGSLGR